MADKKPNNPHLFDGIETGAYTQITLRDLFAAFALVAIDINEKRREAYSSAGKATVDLVAGQAYALADAMLRKREETGA